MSEFNYYATNERQFVRIVKPRQTIMGNWLLCENADGARWYIPFSEMVTAEDGRKIEAERTV